MKVIPSGEACGASITGVDLSEPLDPEVVAAIRREWLVHHVLAFPDQQLTDPDLVRIANTFGTLGDDPYFESITPDNPVVALTRRADEKAPVFAESWHSDWSFKASPPIGTCLYSITVPPVGGETSFSNQQKALADMPDDLRSRLEGKIALHNAAAAYAPDGMYGEGDGSDRSMKILYSEDAREIEKHPIIMVHPESGNETLFGTVGYIVGFEGMAKEESDALLLDLWAWQTRPEFQYTHKWQANMLVIWDNRSVLHRANGGYDGYDRELHRVTVAARPDLFLEPALAS